MPESPVDDPFADLYGKLPDPRARDARTPSGAATSQGASSAPGGDAPQSRRAAREAAARQSSATVETESDAVPVAVGSVATAGAPYSRGVRAQPGPHIDAAAAPARSASTATLEDLFTGEISTDDLGALQPAPKRRKRRIGGWIALGVVLLLLGGAAAGGLWVWNTYENQIREVMGWEEPKDYEPGLAHGEVFVTVSPGDTGWPISEALHAAGVTMTPGAFYDYLIDTGQDPNFQPGVFRLQEQMTSEAALAALMDPANKMENSAQLREGLTVEESLPRLAEGTGIPLEEFETAVANPADYGVAADSLEGWLFPATYTFDPGVTAPQVIQRLVDRTVQSLDSAGVPVEDRHRILTIASIIEREASFGADFYKVARVIENRLDPGNQETYGLLQMDSTAKYGVGENTSGSLDVSQHAQTDDNPWNTYLHPGLPIGPIANPGDLAIDAAMHPADGPWLYFVTVDPSTGETIFTPTYAEHLRYVDQWRAWCRANPDYPC